MRRPVGAEPVRGKQRAPGKEDVALALVDEPGLADVSVAAGTEPVEIGGCFRLPLREPEFHAEHLAVDHGRAVRREHHVRQARNGIDDLHRVAKLQVDLVQLLPLAHRAVRVGRLVRPHPRIDGVRDGEIGWRAHQVAARRGPALRRPGRKQSARSEGFIRPKRRSLLS